MRRLLGRRIVSHRAGVPCVPARDVPRADSVRLKVLLALVLLAFGLCLAAAGCATSSGKAGPSATATVPLRPTATPTALDRLIVSALGGQALAVTTAPGTGTGSLVVTITIAGTVPGTQSAIAAAQERVKTLCYQTLHALVADGMTAGEVTIVVLGPLLDEYAMHVNDIYGSAILEPRTAARLDWTQLTPDSAWPLYDHVYLRNYFYPVD